MMNASSAARARVGTAAWQKESWRGSFYPPGLARANELAFFAARIDTVEINATYYGLQRPSSFVKWRDGVPEHFAFSVKAYKAITHDRMLRGVDRDVAAFFASGPLLLRDKLGPFLWQLPPRLAFDAELIEGFLNRLPRSVEAARSLIASHYGPVEDDLAELPDAPLRHAVEARHPSFAHPRYPELLRRHNVAAVVTNSTRWPVIDAVTADFVYARFDDSLERFPRGQSSEDLNDHAARIREWQNDPASGGASDIFFYFHDSDAHSDNPSDRTPFDAIALQGLVGGEPPAPRASLQTALW